MSGERGSERREFRVLVLDALDWGLDGALTSRAIELYANDVAIDAIAIALIKQFDLDVSYRTIVRWLNGLDLVKPPVAKSKRKARAS